MKRTLALGIIVFCAGAIVAAQDKTEFKTINGVPHALNPAKPLKGTITLEIERTRTINPYDQDDVGMAYFEFSRDMDFRRLQNSAFRRFVLVLPLGLKTDALKFFSTGFGTIDQDGDYSVYREYKINNLPEIFERWAGMIAPITLIIRRCPWDP